MKNRIVSLKSPALKIRQNWTLRLWICVITFAVLILASNVKLRLVHQEHEGVRMPEVTADQLQGNINELQKSIETKQEAIKALSSNDGGIPLEILNMAAHFDGLEILSMVAHPQPEAGAASDIAGADTYMVQITGLIPADAGADMIISALSQAPYVEDYDLNSIEDTLTDTGQKQLFQVSATVFGKKP